MTLYEDYITFGLTPLQGFTHVLARSINCNLSLMSCLYLQFQFRWTTRRFGTVSYYIGYCALTYPITPHPTGKVLLKKERGLIICSGRGIRTPKISGLSRTRIPVPSSRHLKSEEHLEEVSRLTAMFVISDMIGSNYLKSYFQ